MKGTLLTIKLAMNAHFPKKTKSKAKEDQRKIFAFYITLNFIHVADVRFERCAWQSAVNSQRSSHTTELTSRRRLLQLQLSVCHLHIFAHHPALDGGFMPRLVVLNNKLKSDGT